MFPEDRLENVEMQQAENGSEEEATVDVQFTDLPNALIACKVPEDLFNDGSVKVRTTSCAAVLMSARWALYTRWHFSQGPTFWSVGCMLTL